jgi:hypothetical protein
MVWCLRQSNFHLVRPLQNQRLWHFVSTASFSNSATAFSPSTLTSRHLAGVVSILAPEWRYLSPCFGAVLNGTSLKNNLLRLGNSIDKIHNEIGSQNDGHPVNEPSPLQSPCSLAKLLFFQPQPGSPIRLSRSKSMAVGHVTPQILGTLMGISLLPPDERTETKFRQILRDRHGIKSNYVDGKWTGVSLSRWKELTNQLCVVGASCSDEALSLSSLQIAMSTAVWSMAVWECSKSKQCLLQYFMAVQDVSGVDIFSIDDEFVKCGIRFDPAVQADWISQTLNEEELIDPIAPSSLIQSSLKNLISDDDASPVSNVEKARTIEILCATIMSIQQPKSFKPTTPNGYYGYDGGVFKPDCVEVAVRELIDLLLWDETSASFDLSRLPATAVPELIDLYQPAALTPPEGCDDISEGPSLMGGGKEWFDLLSDIPGCDYLSSSPNGRPYELTPTLRNMSKVCRRLLYNGGSLSTPIPVDEDWHSLSSLKECWKGPEIQISFDKLTQKAQMSHDIHVFEIATIGIEGASSLIELRLRCDWARNTGFATVTHLRRFKDKDILDKDTINTVLNLNQGPLQKERIPLILLALALVGEKGLKVNKEHCGVVGVVCALLAPKYGIDRREMMQLAATSDLEREELAYKQASRQSEEILKAATIQVCDFLLTSQSKDGHSDQYRDLGIHLLGWLMTENPQLDSSMSGTEFSARFLRDPEIEFKILGLPKVILTDVSCREILDAYWPRGKVLRNVVDWQIGKLSTLEVLQQMKLKEMPTFILLNRRLKKLNIDFQ